jgi:hypothetical protein
MKTDAKTFPNRNITPRVAVQLECGILFDFESRAMPNSPHRLLLAAHQNGLARRNRFEIHSAEEIWQQA